MPDDLISRSALLRDMGLENAIKYGNQTTEQQHNSYSTLMKYEIADYIQDAPAIDAVSVVRCRECKYRGSELECPMCHDEYYYDEDDGGEYVTRDNTEDNGFCHKGAKMDGGASNGSDA